MELTLKTEGSPQLALPVDQNTLVETWAREVAQSLNAAKKLKDPFEAKPRGSGTAVVSSGSPGLPFLITGTKPHAISGNPILRFLTQGQDVFARKVKHPGTQPDSKLVNTMTQIPEIGSSILERMMG